MSAGVVSVVIPCYNSERFIGATLESVFRSTWHSIEVIIVNDGSTDASQDEIRRFAKDNLKVIHQTNRGQTAALNVGLASATGDFIQYLDADDLISETKIERQVRRLFEEPRCVAMAEWARFRSDPAEADFAAEACWQDMAPTDWLHANLKDGGGMMFPAMWLVPASLARQFAWTEDLTLNNDADYFTRLILASDGVVFCPSARAYYRSGNNSSLSGLKSRAGWISQFKVLASCEQEILAAENSERMRRVISLAWQRMAYACHPYDRNIARAALQRSRELHGIQLAPLGGPKFRAVAKVIGWRAARSLQVWTGRS